jgi:hypothetical protein
MDEIAAQSPEMPDRDWARAQSRHGLARGSSDATLAEPPAPA